MFIYRDMSCSYLTQIDDKYYPDFNIPQYINYVNKSPVNKYFSGVTLLQAPFFSMAHGISKFYNVPADGYSYIYQYAVLFASLFYLWLALCFMRKLFLLYNINEYIITTCMIALVFATNLYRYIIDEPSMSHVYSLCIITLFCYYTKLFFAINKRSAFYTSCLLLGLIILIRPINGIIILSVPFLSGSYSNFKSSISVLLKHSSWLIIGALLCANIALIQCYLWMIQTGVFVVWSYGPNEGFDFLHPQLINVLFSFRKGLFVWTPILLFSLPGIIVLFKKNKFEALTLLGFLFAVVYALSSWREWYYGMSFGFRPMIDFYIFLFLLIAIFASSIKNNWIRIAGLTMIAALIQINTVQTYQYRKYILHWKDMTFEKYKKVFLKTDKEWEGYLWSNVFYDDYYDVIYLKYTSNKIDCTLPLGYTTLLMKPEIKEMEFTKFDSSLDTISNQPIVVRLKFDFENIKQIESNIKFACILAEPGKENISLHEQDMSISKNVISNKTAFRLTTKPKGNQTICFLLVNEKQLSGEIRNVEIEFCKPLN